MPSDCTGTAVFHPEGKPWRARTKALGTVHHLGYYATESEARWAEVQFAKGMREIWGVDE
jgi:hypothetical protein